MMTFEEKIRSLGLTGKPALSHNDVCAIAGLPIGGKVRIVDIEGALKMCVYKTTTKGNRKYAHYTVEQARTVHSKKKHLHEVLMPGAESYNAQIALNQRLMTLEKRIDALEASNATAATSSQMTPPEERLYV